MTETAGTFCLTRRDLVTMAMGAFVVESLPAGARRRRVFRRSVPVMGTIADVAVVNESEVRAAAAIDAVLSELRRIERLLTRFDRSSDVGRLNSAPAGRPVEISGETAAVLVTALDWATRSSGRFDPCIGRLTELWDVANRRTPPAEAAVRRLAGRQLYRLLDVDVAGRVATLGSAEAAVDLGGIAVGYAVDRAVQVIRRHGVAHGLVNVGGDIYALGCSPEDRPWRVGIRSPNDVTRLAKTVELSDAAVTTSGDYMQYFTYRGRRYHHLLDPRTGEPVQGRYHSVTVVAPSCIAADAGATAVFGLPRAEADRVLSTAGAQVVDIA